MGLFKKPEPWVEIPLETMLAAAVKAFEEPGRDLELVREVEDTIAESPPEHIRAAVFITFYACARLADAVLESHPELTHASLVDEVFEQIRKELL